MLVRLSMGRRLATRMRTLRIRQLLRHIYPAVSADKVDYFRLALGEAEAAVEQISSGQESVELSPQSAYIRRLQHLIADRNSLVSQSLGKEPGRRVRISKGKTEV